MKFLREPKDSDKRFTIIFEDMHVPKQWPIVQQVVINDDIGYMRYLINSFSEEARAYWIAFIGLFIRACKEELVDDA